MVWLRVRACMRARVLCMCVCVFEIKHAVSMSRRYDEIEEKNDDDDEDAVRDEMKNLHNTTRDDDIVC